MTGWLWLVAAVVVVCGLGIAAVRRAPDFYFPDDDERTDDEGWGR